MSSALFIRIFGGVFGGVIGTYISGQIYDYFNKTKRPIPQIKESLNYESKYKDVKSFEEILNIEISNQIETEQIDYEYDNEHGNTIDFKHNNDQDKEITLVNDAIYDNSYEDYYHMYNQLYSNDYDI